MKPILLITDVYYNRTYDRRGNWTKRVRRWRDEVADIALREIVYC